MTCFFVCFVLQVDETKYDVSLSFVLAYSSGYDMFIGGAVHVYCSL